MSSTVPAAAPPSAVNYALDPALNLLLIGTVWSSFLIPIAIALFFFSDSRMRRQPIFILNTCAIALGLAVGAINIYNLVSPPYIFTQQCLHQSRVDAIYYWEIRGPEDYHSAHGDILPPPNQRPGNPTLQSSRHISSQADGLEPSAAHIRPVRGPSRHSGRERLDLRGKDTGGRWILREHVPGVAAGVEPAVCEDRVVPPAVLRHVRPYVNLGLIDLTYVRTADTPRPYSSCGFGKATRWPGGTEESTAPLRTPHRVRAQSCATESLQSSD